MKIFFLNFLLIISSVVYAQTTPQVKPINPDFIEFMQDGKSKTVYSDAGYPLNLAPMPTVYNFDNFLFYEKTNKDLPSQYDLRTENGGAYLSSVKNQGLEGACWAFATYAAIESYWMKNGLPEYNLSEQNLATCHGFDWTPSMGGNTILSTAYLTRRSGPILESDDPYTLPSNPNCVTGLSPVAYVAESRYLPSIGTAGFSEELIKDAIIENGALYTSMHFNDSYMNYSNNTYYYNGSENPNHGVAIVGWDDNKTVTGGSIATPSSSGAWIIKNSWGSGWGEGGYFYISYEDTRNLSTLTYFPSYIEYDPNSEVYYYDEFGKISAFGYTGDNYAMIKFDVSENQYLSKIGTSIEEPNTEVTITVYNDFNGTNLIAENIIANINPVTCPFPGYYTFDLETPVNILEGSSIYIKVEYNSTGNYPIPLEVYISDFNSDFQATENTSWISPNGTTNWVQIGENTDYPYNLCIKAYATAMIEEEPTADFTSNTQTVVVGETVNFFDQSSGIPQDYFWTFEGGEPTESSDINPLVQYNLTGTYDVILTVENSFGINTITKEDYITVVSAPVECNYYSNIYPDDEVVYYFMQGGYLTGINDFDFTEFAEYFDNHQNHSLSGVRIGVAIADALSSNAIITMKVWDEFNNKPNSELYSEDFNISEFNTLAYNVLEFEESVIVPDAFFIGYQIYETSPQDTFAIYQTVNRPEESEYESTAYIKRFGLWNNTDDLFEGGFNTAFSISPELCPYPPSADFIADVTHGCDNLTVQFTNLSTSNVDSFSWDFGDGEISNDENPQHTYSNPGVYTVSLTVSNTLGNDTKQIVDYIEVGTTPDPVLVSGGGEQCGGSFILTATGGEGGIIYWQDIYSEGEDTSNPMTSIEIFESGTYYFRSMSDDNCWSIQGEENVIIHDVPEVNLGDDIVQCGGTVILDAGEGFETYLWNAAEGSQVYEIEAYGTYNIILQVTDINNCDATDEINVSLFESPEISTSSTPETDIDANDGTATVDVSQVSGALIIWSTGSDQETITDLPGGYYTVTVTNEFACSETSTVFVSTNAPPQADFTANITSGCDNLTVEFSDNSDYNPETWEWTFGDGETSNEQNPVHSYANHGTFTVSLFVTNAYGDDFIEKTDFIQIGETPEFIINTVNATGLEIADGEASVEILSGYEPFEVNWSNDETGLLVNNLLPGTYSVEVIEAFSCSSSQDFTIDWSTDITKLCTGGISIYPNPSNGIINIEFNSESIQEFELTDIHGKTIYQTKVNSKIIKIDLSDISGGIYFIKYSLDNIMYFDKVIIYN